MGEKNSIKYNTKQLEKGLSLVYNVKWKKQGWESVHSTFPFT